MNLNITFKKFMKDKFGNKKIIPYLYSNHAKKKDHKFHFKANIKLNLMIDPNYRLLSIDSKICTTVLK